MQLKEFMRDYNDSGKMSREQLDELAIKHGFQSWQQASRLAAKNGYVTTESLYSKMKKFIKTDLTAIECKKKIVEKRMQMIAAESNEHGNVTNEIAQKYTYKNKRSAIAAMMGKGYFRCEDGLYRKDLQKAKENKKKASEKKALKNNKKKWVKHRCRKCKRYFRSEISKRDGFPINYLCPQCHESNKQYRNLKAYEIYD